MSLFLSVLVCVCVLCMANSSQIFFSTPQKGQRAPDLPLYSYATLPPFHLLSLPPVTFYWCYSRLVPPLCQVVLTSLFLDIIKWINVSSIFLHSIFLRSEQIRCNFISIMAQKKPKVWILLQLQIQMHNCRFALGQICPHQHLQLCR